MSGTLGKGGGNDAEVLGSGRSDDSRRDESYHRGGGPRLQGQGHAGGSPRRARSKVMHRCPTAPQPANQDKGQRSLPPVSLVGRVRPCPSGKEPTRDYLLALLPASTHRTPGEGAPLRLSDRCIYSGFRLRGRTTGSLPGNEPVGAPGDRWARRCPI